MRTICAVLVAAALAHAEGPALPSAEEIQKRAAAFKFEAGTAGGTLQDWIDADLPTWNLALSTSAQASSILSGFVFETLLTTDPLTGQCAPLLAEEVPSKSEDEDGRVWIVKLKHGVTWGDGEPFNADDVLFTFNDIVLNEKIPCPSRPVLQMTVEGQVKNVLVEKVDDFTLRFTLPRRYAMVRQVINASCIFPRHALETSVRDGTFGETWDIDDPASEVVGTGPFTPAEHHLQRGVWLKRNPRFRGKDEAGNALPYLDKIFYRIVSDPGGQLKLFTSGALDYLEVRAGDVDMLAKEAAKNGKFDVVSTGPRPGWSYLAFNQNPRSRADGTPYVAAHKSAWFRDVRFRRAVSHCLDRDRIVKEVYFGRARALWGPYTPKFPEYFTDDVPKYPFDLEKARALLDDMGLKDTDADGVRDDGKGNAVEFKLTVISNQPSVQLLTAPLEEDLASVGVRMTVEEVSFNLLVRRISTDWDWEAVIMGYTAGAEPLLGKVIWKTGEARRIWNPKADPAGAETRPWEKRIDEIFDEAYTHWDPKTRSFDHARDVELAHEWQRIAAENLPHIYLFSTPSVYAFSKRLGNVRTTLNSLYDIERVFIRK